jgi:hypothetical protein
VRLCRDWRAVTDEKSVYFYAEMLPECQKKTHKYDNSYVIDYYTCGTKKNMYVAVKTFYSR